jgi:hypothetical protein
MLAVPPGSNNAESHALVVRKFFRVPRRHEGGEGETKENIPPLKSVAPFAPSRDTGNFLAHRTRARLDASASRDTFAPRCAAE